MSQQKECTFCKRDGIEPPAMGDRATGSYRRAGTWDTQSRVFNGYVCEMHSDTVDWNKLRYKNGGKQQ